MMKNIFVMLVFALMSLITTVLCAQEYGGYKIPVNPDTITITERQEKPDPLKIYRGSVLECLHALNKKNKKNKEAHKAQKVWNYFSESLFLTMEEDDLSLMKKSGPYWDSIVSLVKSVWMETKKTGDQMIVRKDVEMRTYLFLDKIVFPLMKMGYITGEFSGEIEGIKKRGNRPFDDMSHTLLSNAKNLSKKDRDSLFEVLGSDYSMRLCRNHPEYYPETLDKVLKDPITWYYPSFLRKFLQIPSLAQEAWNGFVTKKVLLETSDLCWFFLENEMPGDSLRVVVINAFLSAGGMRGDLDEIFFDHATTNEKSYIMRYLREHPSQDPTWIEVASSIALDYENPYTRRGSSLKYKIIKQAKEGRSSMIKE